VVRSAEPQAAHRRDRPNASRTDWAQIVGLYDAPARTDPSPVVGRRLGELRRLA
jgi:predicted RNA polymerase sigma factor